MEKSYCTFTSITDASWSQGWGEGGSILVRKVAAIPLEPQAAAHGHYLRRRNCLQLYLQWLHGFILVLSKKSYSTVTTNQVWPSGKRDLLVPHILVWLLYFLCCTSQSKCMCCSCTMCLQWHCRCSFQFLDRQILTTGTQCQSITWQYPMQTTVLAS